MFKKTVAVLMMVLMIFPSTQAFAFAVDNQTEQAGVDNVLCISTNIDFNSDNVEYKDVYMFNNAETSSLLKYDMLSMTGSDLSLVNAQKVVELIDNGAVLYLEDEAVSLERISTILEIPEPDNRFVNGAQVTGAFVFNVNNNYCYGITGVIECEPVDWNNLEPLEPKDDADVEHYYEPILVGVKCANVNTTVKNAVENVRIDANDFLGAIDAFRQKFIEQAHKAVEDDVVYMQLPAKGFDGSPYYNYFSLTASTGLQFGSATITQYRYDICTYMSGSTKNAIVDIVSSFTISPSTTLYVNNYLTRMHANVSNMDIIGQSYLDSNSSSSYTLSGGFSATSGNVLTGSIGASTTNTYSTNNQTIQNDFFHQKYKNWNPTPTKKWTGSSWEIEPAIRIINNNATTYQNQAYSSFRNGGWIGVQNVIGWTIPTVEVGGSWIAN